MTDMTTAPAHRFTVGGALGFGLEVFRARPGAVLTLLALQTLIYLAHTVFQYGIIGQLAREGVMAADAGDMAEAFTINMNLSAFSSLFWLLSAPLWLWLEAVWLVLFMSGRFTLWPGWGNLGRMTLGFIILFAVYMGSLIALMVVMALGVVIFTLIHQGGGDAGLLTRIGGFLGLLLLIVFLAALALFSALPAHGVMGRFDIGQAVRTAWRHMGGVVFSWIVFILLYLIVMAITYGLVGLAFHDQIRTVIETLSTQPSDPLFALRLYAVILPETQDLPVLAMVLAPPMLVLSAMMVIGRGIGAKLALSMPKMSKDAV